MIRDGDAFWMRRALRLARRHAGSTWPNPTVGACIVREGRLLAEAAHRAAGKQHAEILALGHLRERGDDASGATLYVTLEPCHHEGRTPPCSRAIVDSGIRRVVYAVRDSNPRVTGGGGAWLCGQGLQVQEGPYGPLAWELNHPFFETGGGTEVHVTLKLAISLDGRMARARGPVPQAAQRWITGPPARRRVHRMRAGAGAVLVGRGTVEADRPRLDARELPADARQGASPGPRPVILDGSLGLQPSWLPPGSLVLTSENGLAARTLEPWQERGHEIVGCPVDPRSGRLSWDGILSLLYHRGLGILLVEGGATVAADLLAAGRAHRVHLFTAPSLLGGDGAGLFDYRGPETAYHSVRARRVGQDLEWVLRRADLPTPPC